MRDQPDLELEVLEEDQTVPPRPDEAIADVDRREETMGRLRRAETSPLLKPGARVTGDP